MKNSTKNIVIIDYGLGNLFSVKHACAHFGYNAVIANEKEALDTADAIILPGVGAFSKAMENLKKNDLVGPIQDYIAAKKPFFGICLGLQLLFDESEEFGTSKGLGIIPGTVKKFPSENRAGEQMKIPYIGWNQITSPADGKWAASPLREISEEEYMYFVHSYYVVPENEDDILTLTNYGDVTYCSGIMKENIVAMQFHPEKSATSGLSIYKQWFDMIFSEGE